MIFNNTNWPQIYDLNGDCAQIQIGNEFRHLTVYFHRHLTINEGQFIAIENEEARKVQKRMIRGRHMHMTRKISVYYVKSNTEII